MAFKKGHTINNGKKFSEEHRKKLSDKKKGSIPWNKGLKGIMKPNKTSFKKGQTPWNKGMKTSLDVIKKLSESHKGKHISPKTEFKKGIRISTKTEFKKGNIPWNKGLTGIKTHNEKSKEKISKAISKYIEKCGYKSGFCPNNGKYEKQILDLIEKILNIKIERQYKVGKYFIDGYCKELNLAIEVDELHHNKQIEKDKIRQQNIENILGCKFLRI